MSSFVWSPLSNKGVNIYATLSVFPVSTTTGDLAVDASTGNLYEFNGTSWQQIGGPTAALSIGNLDAQTANTKGQALSGGVLSAQSATASFPGLVNNTTQSFSGNKTFTGTIAASNLSGTNTGDVTLGTASGLSLSSQSLSLGLASSGVTGALSGTDWTTFNNKQAAGNYITALTGDATASGPGSAALTLATVNTNVGSFGTATQVGSFTVNGKGLITAASNTSIQIAESQVTNLVSDLAGKQATGNYITALTGDGTAAGPGSVAFTLATVNSNVGSFGSASSVTTLTTNAKGLTTAAASVSIQIAESQVTNLVSDLAGKQTALTIGDLTDAGTDGITVTGGTSSIIGSGVSLSQHVADSTHNGYLSSTDWSTFNNKGSGTVTAVSVASANGFTGSSSGGATPALTLTTSITGILQGNGTAISAASTTGSGNVVLATAPTMTNPVVGTQSQGDSSTKAASTSYVDVAVANAIAGVNPAVAVQAATTSASNTSGFTYNNGASGIGAFFTGAVNTALTVDGYTFTALGQRLLVKNDTQSPSGAFNGVYYVTQVQTAILPLVLTRALDYDMPSDMNNTGAIPVINGTVNGTTSWVLTSLITTVGTDPLTFVEFTRNPADYLLKTNNLSDVSSTTTAFNNISPMTTGGDIIYGGTSGAGTRLANGSSGTFLKSNGGTSAPSWASPTISLTAPTVQKFTSSTGTYTTPASVLYIRIQMVGGGGGGDAGGTGSTGVTAGGNSTFGTTLLTANGGGAGTRGGNGGAGGTASLGTGPIGTALSGGSGTGGALEQAQAALNYTTGGCGASSPFGGAGGGGGQQNNAQAAIANSGSGGGGGSGNGNVNANVSGGAGGGAGGYVDAIITSPSATYSYAVGAGGTKGTSSASGTDGGNGGSGYIVVTEFYQ